MRGLFIVLELGLTTMTAPSSASASPAGEVHAEEIDHLLRSGRRVRTAGQVLVGLGCVDAILATVIGAVAIAAPPDNLGDVTPGSVRGSEVPALEGAAIGLAVAAAALIAVGIPLMAEGDGRLARAHRLVGKAPFRLAATAGGIEVSW